MILAWAGRTVCAYTLQQRITSLKSVLPCPSKGGGAIEGLVHVVSLNLVATARTTPRDARVNNHLQFLSF